MKEEISRILAMVEAGKLDADKATELIHVLKEKESDARQKDSQQYLDKMLLVRVLSEHGDNVSVNLPLRLIKVALKTGLNIASAIPDSAKYVKDIDAIDIDLILEAIENELTGPIVNVTSANGDKVSVVIE